MSPESRVTAFIPQAIAPAGSERSDGSRAAGFAAGWAAGARAASEAAAAARAVEQADHEARELVRDQQLASAVAALSSAAARLDARLAPALLDAERELHMAALELAQAVLGREVRPGPESAKALLDRALAMAPDLLVTVVRVHPDDLAQIEELLDAGKASVPEGLTLVADARLEHGDAITEHEDGALDSRIRGGLDRARAILLEQP